ncbi:uncharacterized protein LOC143294057 [Babylonia areolata]|uniref:uncharacterized protein LOC143294057 n=1 Tax=Babylonia areolata TaxID=304850 RepID=UPI003FD0BB96
MKEELVVVLCVVVLCSLQRTAEADRDSGCPSYGCLPSGTFALSSDVPGADGSPVGTRWTVLVSGEKDKGTSRFGCLSSQEGVACVTQSGFVAVDQLKGNIAWRYDHLTSPSMPILDVEGGVIGTDGRHLVKIDADGKVEPVINFYGDLNPMFSIQLTNNDLMLLTTYTSGLLITYGTDGIPEASFPLRGEIQRVNGSFVPVAQPVIYGMRAYILAEFVPDTPVSQTEQIPQVLGLQRLYAVDLWRRMTQRISPVWYFNFEREKSCPPDHNRHHHHHHRPEAQPQSGAAFLLVVLLILILILVLPFPVLWELCAGSQWHCVCQSGQTPVWWLWAKTWRAGWTGIW